MKGYGGCRPGTRPLLVPYLTHTLSTLRIDHSIAWFPTQSVGSVNPRSTFTPTHNLSVEGVPILTGTSSGTMLFPNQAT